MRIYYSPEFNGKVFLGLRDKDVLLDTDIVDTMGLIRLIELRLGLQFYGVDSSERETAYYKSVSRYMSNHPDNVLRHSFELSSLEVSKACLQWRDTLTLLGWNSETPAASKRLSVLCGIEKDFHCPGFPERLNSATEALKQCGDVFVGDSIFLPCPKDLLHPAVRTILELMVDDGASICSLPVASGDNNNLSMVRSILSKTSREKIRLNPGDCSFKIWHFATELDALTYLAFQSDDLFDVWINADNKALDNWLKMMGKPTAGSILNGCIPQTVQLLSLGVNLFYRPLNVFTIL